MSKVIGSADALHTDRQEPHEELSSNGMTPARLTRVLSAISPPGGAALLVGDPWSGKHRLAEEAAYALQQDPSTHARVLLLPAPPPRNGTDAEFEAQFLAQFGITIAEGALHQPTPQSLSMRIIETIMHDADTIVVAAPSIDRYPLRVSTMLSALARSGNIRLVGTARHLSGGAAQIASDPRVHRLSIGPLSFSEASFMLTNLLGGTHIEFSTLHRWHAITNGYIHALTVLALALDRRGAIVRDKGMIWEKSQQPIAIPEEFLTYLEQACTPAELDTLEAIALAEPVSESVLIEQFSPEHLVSLHSIGLIATRPTADGGTALVIRHPWLSRALKNRMSAERRQHANQELYLRLRHDLDGQEAASMPNRLARLVDLGLEASRILPIEWLYAVLNDPVLDQDLEGKLHISLAIIHHPDAFGPRLAEAALTVCHSARQIGNHRAVAEAAEIIRDLSKASGSLHSLDPMLRLRLQLELITHLTLDLDECDTAATAITRLTQEAHEPGSYEAELIRSARTLLYARTGQLRLAAAIAPAPEDEASMPIEWVRTPARFVSSQMLTQQGQFSRAITSADRARTLSLLSNRSDLLAADELTLAVFIAQWSAGLMSAAAETMAQVQDQALSRTYDTGLMEVGLAALALGEGRWRDAAQHGSRAYERFCEHDVLGIAGLSSAIAGYAHAVLGERALARKGFLMAETTRSGTGQTLRGLVRILTLEARLWNNEADVIDRANQTIAWAHAEGLVFIELRTLLVLVSAQGSLYPTWLARARHLAGQVDEPMSSALLAYLEEGNSGPPGHDGPSVRFLSDLGIWVPLPQTPLLSAREREIALHAALGYSSRWIADHFYLSPRTVETHLRHVFTKLDVSSRDELRSHLRNGSLSSADHDSKQWRTSA